jgi:hypothetical protein
LPTDELITVEVENETRQKDVVSQGCIDYIEGVDPPETDVYNPAAIRVAPDEYYAFPSLFRHADWEHEWFTPWQLPHDGCLQSYFAVSRDGEHWRRNTKPYFPRGVMNTNTGAREFMWSGMFETEHETHQICYRSDITHLLRRDPRQNGADAWGECYRVSRPKGRFVGLETYGPHSDEAVIVTHLVIPKLWIILDIAPAVTARVTVQLLDGNDIAWEYVVSTRELVSTFGLKIKVPPQLKRKPYNMVVRGQNFALYGYETTDGDTYVGSVDIS